MTELPAPLTPADCDLRHGFPYMPLHAARLRDSELASNETPEACWAAVLLWCASWHQVPAASVPDDDMWLASQTKYVIRGKFDKAWKNVRAGALRGWIKCGDGRLYHPVVAEQALEAWLSKLVSSLAGANGNAKRWGIEIDTDAVKAQIVDAAGRLRAIAPRSEWLKKKQVRDILAESPPDKKASPPDDKSDPPRSPDASPPDGHPNRPPIANETKRNEVNTSGVNDDVGNLIRGELVDNSASSPLSASEIVDTLTAWERERGKPPRFEASQPQVAVWVLRQLNASQLRRAYDLAVAARDDANDTTAVNVGFLDGFVAKALAPPKPKSLALRSMTGVELEAEGKRLGVSTHGLSRDQCIARIEAKRTEQRGGHMP